MWLEGQNGGRQTGAMRGIDQAIQQSRMATMNTVEIADSQGCWARNRTRKPAKNPHLKLEKRVDYSGLSAPAPLSPNIPRKQTLKITIFYTPFAIISAPPAATKPSPSKCSS
jgi:hypothetical protein